MLPLVTSYRTNSHRTRVMPFNCPAPFNILCLKSMPPQGRKINHLFTHSFIPQCLPGCRLPPRFLSHIHQWTEQGKAPVLLELTGGKQVIKNKLNKQISQKMINKYYRKEKQSNTRGFAEPELMVQAAALNMEVKVASGSWDVSKHSKWVSWPHGEGLPGRENSDQGPVVGMCCQVPGGHCGWGPVREGEEEKSRREVGLGVLGRLFGSYSEWCGTDCRAVSRWVTWLNF